MLHPPEHVYDTYNYNTPARRRLARLAGMDMMADWFRSNPQTSVFRLSGQFVGYFDHSDSILTVHPNGTLLAYVRSDQKEARVEFAVIDEEVIQTYHARFGCGSEKGPARWHLWPLT